MEDDWSSHDDEITGNDLEKEMMETPAMMMV